VVDFMVKWSVATELPGASLLRQTGLYPSKFARWKERYGKALEHNARVPRDHWLEEWEVKAIVEFHDLNPDEGYRRLTYMLIDANKVAVSAATVYRVLKKAGRLERWNRKPSLKGTGFIQPGAPHRHWHIDIAYLNLGGTFYYLCTILDGYSRAVVHWELKGSMREGDVELVVQRGREQHPTERPRIISDNGPQFIARDFKEFIREAGLTHVRTSVYYPQSNGKLERYHKTLKTEGIRPRAPQTEEEARQVVDGFVRYYNEVRLHSAIGYITPADCLAGRRAEIHAARDRKLEAARDRRAQSRRQAREQATASGAAGKSPVGASGTLGEGTPSPPQTPPLPPPTPIPPRAGAFGKVPSDPTGLHCGGGTHSRPTSTHQDSITATISTSDDLNIDPKTGGEDRRGEHRDNLASVASAEPGSSNSD
jgi:transposase InsO family protein